MVLSLGCFWFVLYTPFAFITVYLGEYRVFLVIFQSGSLIMCVIKLLCVILILCLFVQLFNFSGRPFTYVWQFNICIMYHLVFCYLCLAMIAYFVESVFDSFRYYCGHKQFFTLFIAFILDSELVYFISPSTIPMVTLFFCSSGCLELNCMYLLL